MSELTDRVAQFASTARREVDDQIEKVRKAVDGEGTKGTMAETAILQALSERETGAMTILAATTVKTSLRHVGRMVEESAGTVAGKIDAFTEAASRSTTSLNTWTRVLAFATIALAVFALIQIAVAVMGLFSPPQTIVIPAARP